MAHFHSAPVPCPPHPPSPHCPHPLPSPFSLTLSLCCLSPDPHFPCHQCPRRLYLPAPAYAALNLSFPVTVLGFRLNIDVSCIYLSPSLPLPSMPLPSLPAPSVPKPFCSQPLTLETVILSKFLSTHPLHNGKNSWQEALSGFESMLKLFHLWPI